MWVEGSGFILFIFAFSYTLVPHAPNGQHVIRADHRFEDESHLPQRCDPESPVCRSRLVAIYAREDMFCCGGGVVLFIVVFFRIYTL